MYKAMLLSIMLWAGHAETAHASGARVSCAAAATLTIPGIHIAEAREIPVNDSLRALGRRAHCRIAGTVDSVTKFVALFPNDWNGRFLMGGGGGFVGRVDNQFASTVHAGYATVGTDAGHEGHPLSAAWAYGHPERVQRFAHTATHRAAEASKLLIAAFYGREAEHSYFVGCSNGGRQALIEAQRYPADFDGIVAIAPAYDFIDMAFVFLRNFRAQYPNGDVTRPVLTQAAVNRLTTTVLQQCDTLDGVRDDVISDPDRCQFRRDRLTACSTARTAECFSEAEVAAISAILSPLDLGTRTYPAFPLGNEASAGSWGNWIIGPDRPALQATGDYAPSWQAAFGTGMMRGLVYDDSTWDYRTADLMKTRRDAAKAMALLHADDPDLSAFRARGGKLILAHGWSDPAINARSTIQYFDAVQKRTQKASEFTRLFLMPGVLHCEGGSGCDSVDWATAISSWVEQGAAPDVIPAKKLNGTQVVRTRPLCAHPAKAVYRGTGDTNVAENFTCAR